MVMNEAKQLAKLIDFCVNDDFYEEEAWEYLQDRKLPVVSHSRQYVITRAFNAGWRPNAPL